MERPMRQRVSGLNRLLGEQLDTLDLSFSTVRPAISGDCLTRRRS